MRLNLIQRYVRHLSTMGDSRLICVTDYEKRAEGLLDKRAWNQISTGADDEQTLRDNVCDFKRLRLRPQMMVDVSNIKLNTTILGEKIEYPVCAAPASTQRLAHPIGEAGTARAVESAGTCICLSTGSNCSIEEVAAAAPNTLKWFQLYVLQDRTLTRSLVERAERAGYKALVITVDLPELGNRRRSQRERFDQIPPYLSLGNFDEENNDWWWQHSKSFDNTLTWKDMAWLKSITKMPIVVKGILTGFDAINALEAGCSAIYVSNHGGRQLDGASSTILALEEVVKAVDGRVEVYLDSGVRCGSDVLKALALGARAVFIGRPIFWGLSVAGEDGVKSILQILKKELTLAMQLSGVTDVEKVPRDLVYYDFTHSRL